MKVALTQQFFMFVMVGLINTLFGYGLFSLFIYLGIHYVVAVFLSTAAGILFNFNTTGKFVFKNKNPQLFFKFTAAYVFLYAINVFLLWLLHFKVQNIYLAGFITIFLMVGISFTFNKWWVFGSIPETDRKMV